MARFEIVFRKIQVKMFRCSVWTHRDAGYDRGSYPGKEVSLSLTNSEQSVHWFRIFKIQSSSDVKSDRQIWSSLKRALSKNLKEEESKDQIWHLNWVRFELPKHQIG